MLTSPLVRLANSFASVSATSLSYFLGFKLLANSARRSSSAFRLGLKEDIDRNQLAQARLMKTRSPCSSAICGRNHSLHLLAFPRPAGERVPRAEGARRERGNCISDALPGSCSHSLRTSLPSPVGGRGEASTAEMTFAICSADQIGAIECREHPGCGLEQCGVALGAAHELQAERHILIRQQRQCERRNTKQRSRNVHDGIAGGGESDRRGTGCGQRDERVIIFRGLGEGGTCSVAPRDQIGVV